MTRRLRQLNEGHFERLPGSCSCCTFWESAGERPRRCGATCDHDLQLAWYRRVSDEWGGCGLVAVEDDEVLGVIKYAPSGYFPQVASFAAKPSDPSVPLIACLHITPETRHHGLGGVLLKAALRDLVGRGERRVQAFGAAEAPEQVDGFPVMSVQFLERNGFTVEVPDPRFPLMRLDLRSLAMWTENLEAAFDALRFPHRVPTSAPASMSGKK